MIRTELNLYRLRKTIAQKLMGRSFWKLYFTSTLWVNFAVKKREKQIPKWKWNWIWSFQRRQKKKPQFKDQFICVQELAIYDDFCSARLSVSLQRDWKGGHRFICIDFTPGDLLTAFSNDQLQIISLNDKYRFDAYICFGTTKESTNKVTLKFSRHLIQFPLHLVIKLVLSLLCSPLSLMYLNNKS